MKDRHAGSSAVKDLVGIWLHEQDWQASVTVAVQYIVSTLQYINWLINESEMIYQFIH